MSSEGLTTAVEVGRSLYVYSGDTLVSRSVHIESSVAEAIEKLKSTTENFRHLMIHHWNWDTLMDWEDRVDTSSLSTLLESSASRRLVVTDLTDKE